KMRPNAEKLQPRKPTSTRSNTLVKLPEFMVWETVATHWTDPEAGWFKANHRKSVDTPYDGNIHAMATYGVVPRPEVGFRHGHRSRKHRRRIDRKRGDRLSFQPIPNCHLLLPAGRLDAGAGLPRPTVASRRVRSPRRNNNRAEDRLHESRNVEGLWCR